MVVRKQKSLKFAVAALLAGAVYLIFHYRRIIMGILSPVLISLALAYLLNPVVCRIEGRGIRRFAAIIMLYLILGLALVGLLFYFVPELIRDSGKLMDMLPQLNEQLLSFVRSAQDRLSGTGMPAGFKSSFEKSASRIESYLTGYISSAAESVILHMPKVTDLLLIPFLLYYFLRDFDKLGLNLKKLIPRKYRDSVIAVGSSVDELVGSYVKTQLILSGIIASLTTLTLLALRVNFALILGIVNGIMNIIPYFGPFIGAVPAVIIALLDSPMKALYTIIAAAAIQEIESGIISPKLTSDSVNLHPVTVMLALILGGEMFGISGMILSVPIAAAIKVVFNSLTKNLF